MLECNQNLHECIGGEVARGKNCTGKVAQGDFLYGEMLKVTNIKGAIGERIY